MNHAARNQSSTEAELVKLEYPSTDRRFLTPITPTTEPNYIQNAKEPKI